MIKKKIAERAYSIWQANGCRDGRQLDDWLKAEAELLDEAIRDACIQSKIAARAYAIWQANGCSEDRALSDWLQAEKEVSSFSIN